MNGWYFLVGCFGICFIQEGLAMSDEMKELAQMLHNTCVVETGVSEYLIEKVNSEKVFADDENLKCYIKCLMSQMACIDDDGLIDVEATIAVLPEEMQEEAAPVVRTCGTKIGANPCDNAWLTHKCYSEMKPNVSVVKISIRLREPTMLGPFTFTSFNNII